MVFNNLAPWGEKKFVSELKRTYKFKRGGYCHTEDNSPKYRMVGEILSILRSFAVQTRIFAKECNIIAVGYVRSTAQDDENLNRFRNKCAMTWNSDMEENNFTDKVFSRFTSHFSLKRTSATHVALYDSVGSYFRHWCGAFTLAEVLITLGIIGVVAAMTLPSLVQNYRKSVVENKLKSEYSLISNAIRMSEAKNGSSEDWATCDEDNSFECTKSFFDIYLAPELKTVKICGNDNKEECWTEPVSLSGKKGYLSPLIDNKGLTAILSNGTSLYMWAGGQNSEAAHLQIWFDIDGPTKGKGIIGADVFGTITFFKAREEIRAGTFMQGCAKLLDVDNYKNDTEYGCSKDVDSQFAGFYCGALIEQNGWKIPKDYPVRL